MSNISIERDVVRVLFILYFCGEKSPPSLFEEYAYTHSLDSETKLQKFDFWLRYPDYLAAALLQEYETGTLQPRVHEIQQIVRHILLEREPVLRLTPMRKYLHGAYESLDKVMIYLV